MLDRATRLAPLTGIAFLVLVIVGGPVLEQTTPGATASPASVIAFYSAHRDRERAAVYVLAFGFVAFLFFAGVLRSRWRDRVGCEGLSALLLTAAGVVVVGQCTTDGAIFALVADPTHLDPSTAHTLDLVSNDMVVVSAVGFLLYGLTAGLLVLRGPGVVPTWLGWVAIVMGVLFLVPPVEFAGFLVLLVWVAVVSVLLVRAEAALPAVPETQPARL